jgi:choline dehydrogenase
MTNYSNIVGAGTAGAALAGRLSEDLGTTVLLFEAGPDYRTADMPLAMRSPNLGRIFDAERFLPFQYPALQARRSAAQQPRPFMRGRGVGGSSAINAQLAIRGLPADFDGWAAQGCVGWAWTDVLPTFIRLEDDADFGDVPYHGQGGPIPIRRAPQAQWGPVERARRDAALALGYGWANDHNAPETTGVSPYANNCRADVRVSTNDAYLEPARSRPNLTIWGDALVDRVCFDGHRASGVRVRTAEGWTEVAGRAVIVSAGAIHSPAILLRSGIGPAADVRALGIDLVRDAPVGQNLGEHAGLPLLLRLVPTARAASPDIRFSNCCVRYDSGLAGTGPNDMFMLSGNVTGDDGTGLATGLLLVAVYQTFSRGHLRLASVDPAVDPEVDFRLLTDERDLTRLRDGAAHLWAILHHPAVGAITAEIVGRTTGQVVTNLPRGTDLDAWLLEEVNDVLHPVGTCRMGAVDDPRSVVDPQCRVIGVEGLRVIDASVMPDVPRANTHLTTVMIAEHLAACLVP